MRIATSSLAGLSLLFAAFEARGEPEPPPPPPEPGVSSADAFPPPLASPFVATETAADDRPLAGFRDGFFVRDDKDIVRLYPRGLVQLDFLGFAGEGLSTYEQRALAQSGQDPARDRFAVRRARVELGAELFRRWSFYAGMEAGSETSPRLSDAWVSYAALPFANLMAGQFDVPFSMENRTRYERMSWMERNAATRFVVPSPKDQGLMLWGDFNREVLAYEIGVFGGQGQDHPGLDDAFDFMGRVYARPLATGASDDFGRYLQIGVSARHGTRDPKYVGYDVPALTTNQGVPVFQPNYVDSQGRLEHVLPSGAQNAIGVELRMRAGRFGLRGEGYYTADDTREAVDGHQLTNTERLGVLRGGAFYVEASAWPLGQPFLNGDPGIIRPPSLDWSAKMPERPPRGLEVLVLVANVTGHYDGASRDGSPDANTPNADVRVWQTGVGMNYWHTRFVHVGVNYFVYVTPSGGDATKNLASTPNGHPLHEIGARVSFSL